MIEERIYTECKYLKDPIVTDRNDAIYCKINGVVTTVPLDIHNVDYAEIKRLVDEGKLKIAEGED